MERAMFGNLEEQWPITEEYSYVDDILTSNNDLERLNKNIKGLKRF